MITIHKMFLKRMQTEPQWIEPTSSCQCLSPVWCPKTKLLFQSFILTDRILTLSIHSFKEIFPFIFKEVNKCNVAVSVSQRSEKKTRWICININQSKMIKNRENNLDKSSVGRKVWKLHPHLVLLDYVRRTEHLPCNKESRHCGIENIAGKYNVLQKWQGNS